MWNVDTLEEIGGQALFKHTCCLSGVVFTQDGRWLVVADQLGVIRVWDTNDWQLAREFKIDLYPSVIAISPDSSQLAIGSREWGASLWDFKTETLQARLDVESDIASLAYSSDGQTLVSGGGDGAVQLWDTVWGRLLSTLYAHTDRVNGVDFSPDGTVLATAGLEGVLRLWKTATLEDIDKHPLTLRSLLNSANKCLERHQFCLLYTSPSPRD